MVSILGCGWLGLPLAQHFIAHGISVKGSTTQQSKLSLLDSFGITPYLIQLSDGPPKGDFQDFLSNDILIINIPPSRDFKSVENYIQSLVDINHYITASPIEKIIFISSTSVYKNAELAIDENGEIEEQGAGKNLYLAEELFRQNNAVRTTIIRMAGLFGPNRPPGRFFSGKPSVPNALAPVNMIHLDDCIAIIKKVIDENYWNQTMNACAPDHPSRKEFYTEAIKLYGGAMPEFVEEKGQWKIISPQKLLTDLDYQFIHPDLIKSLHTL